MRNSPIMHVGDITTFQDATGNKITVSLQDRNLYLSLCNEDWTQMRHHETQRATVASVGFGVSGAILGLVAKNGFTSSEAFFMGIALAAVAALAGLVSYKHYERSRLHTERAAMYRDAIDSTLLRLEDLRQQADDKHGSKYPIFSQKNGPFRLHILWNAFFMLMVCIGLLVALGSYPTWKAGRPSPSRTVCSSPSK